MTTTYELKLSQQQQSCYKIGNGLLSTFEDHVSGISYDHLCIVYDQDLPSPLLQECLPLLRSMTSSLIAISGSEENKEWQTVYTLIKSFHEMALTRRCLIVALGGGAIGDLVGFAASIYKRGVNWVFIPTTLTSQIDSSIGGKTAINTDHGKNQIGTFHCPKLVIADTTLLRFLPGRYLQAGMAEIIKIAAMMDSSLLDQLHNFNLFTINDMGDIFEKAARLKIEIVNDDPWEEKELGRTRLNFGHTLGHAIESYYQPHIIHGEAIAVGMLGELALAQKLGQYPFTESWYESFTDLIVSFIPEHILYPLPPFANIASYLRQDKKAITEGIPLIIPHPTEQAQRFFLPPKELSNI